MANWDKLKSLVNQMNDELYSENVSSNAGVELANMQRFVKQYRDDLNADIMGEKAVIETNRENGLTISAIEQEGFVRGLIYALNNFNYFFGENND
jgi:beta-lactamase class D